MICDVKNHVVREANLHTKQVRKVAGVPGIRGQDLEGGILPASQQELASPWDILRAETGEFLVAMAGTHQIWTLNLKEDRCKVYSGNGSEGNSNSGPNDTTWAQP